MKSKEKKVQYSVALSMVKNLGPQMYKKLLGVFGTAENVFHMLAKHNANETKIRHDIVTQITKKKNHLLSKAEKVLTSHYEKGFNVIPYENECYPDRLRQIYSAPPILYTSRSLDLNKFRCIAVVGTRNATNYGKQFVKEFIANLSVYNNVVIISGLAYGIDICAHKEALACGLPTVAVVAGGLNMIYPAEHATHLKAINEKGCVISEYPLDVKPEKHHFPSRNRIIAGLVDGVVIVEADQKSGALITAKYANEFGREVFALPGSIKATYSKGNHYLIKTHQAHIITETKDFTYVMNWETTNTSVAQPQKLRHRAFFGNLAGEEKSVVTMLEKYVALSMDELSTKTRICLEKLSRLMIQLEMKRFIANVPGNKYALCV